MSQVNSYVHGGTPVHLDTLCLVGSMGIVAMDSILFHFALLFLQQMISLRYSPWDAKIKVVILNVPIRVEH